MDQTVEQLLAGRDPAIAELARSACSLIAEHYPGAVVTVEGNDIGFGSGRGYKGLVFTVSPSQRHVTLGFFGGAALDDPGGLLEGSGKVHRHVKLHRPDDVQRAELRDLIVAALARTRLAAPPAGRDHTRR